MIADQKLVKWLELEMITGEPVNRFELFHAVEGEGAERCQVFPTEESMNLAELAQQIWDVAETDAETRTAGMPQRYVLWSYHGEAMEPQSQHPFTLRGRAAGALMTSSQDSEPATDRGERAQQMRQLENQHRMIMLMADSTAGRLVTELQREQARREAAETRMMEITRREQDLLDRKAERDLAVAKEESRQAVIHDLARSVMSFVPLLAAKFLAGTGPIAGTANGAARDQAVGRVLKNLSTEEIEGVMSNIKDKNKLAFIELYKSYRDDDAKEQEKKPIPFRDRERRLLKPVGGSGSK